ncbi:MAG TPA: DEAD/DEAH box helicase [Solirubrobacteraceae bacterium]|nr:DEAD/DEAH box helicase [Solirubrobacteraceae bacterium]
MPHGSDRDPLSGFNPRVRDWFAAAFAAPTPAQAQAWPAIARGENVLLSAPTGSGKTLAAFLWALDRLGGDHATARPGAGGEPGAGPARAHAAGRSTRVVYVSPLKALAYDIERNLRTPLRGIGAADAVSVGIRTGDTPQRERAAMVRNPPDILITTPESLYLILTSRAAAMLSGVQAVIVDEIHAVAHSKRGSHLALTLERLDALVSRSHRARDGGSADRGSSSVVASSAQDEHAGAPAPTPTHPLQRIGLSATQRPLDEIGRFLVGPRREVTILDAAAPAQLDLRIEVPVESMAEPGARDLPADGAPPDPLEPIAGGESTRGSIWPAIYPELLRCVREHTSTIVFVNNRRAAERVALRLNELAAREDAGAGDADDGTGGRDGSGGASREIARAHHGSLAREERTRVEELLKAGELPCLVATSSLELGIDMGAVDLVLQVESPKSVARGLQRVGRAGHGVGEVSRGRFFPKYRGDLLECAVVCRLMRAGQIEPTVVPRNALDVLAQQIVSIAVAAEDEDGVRVDDLYALVTNTWSYADLSRELLERVLDMLDGRYPDTSFGDRSTIGLRPRIVWDRLAGVIHPRRGARQLAVANAGTIPDRGLYTVTLPDGRRVGELDEEMVYEARAGQAFMLGASTWRIEEIGRDRVIVTPAPGAPGAVPFWKGDTLGRPFELGREIGAFARWALEQDEATLRREYDLDERAAHNLLAYLREQLAATRVLPSDRTIVLERFRDEIGDWRLCLLSPYGGRVHAAWALALSARVRERYGLEADALWSDDGIVLRLPELDDEQARSLPSASELVLIEPDELQQAVMAELGSSALFGARFREAAARALLIPRAWPGRRTPLWQQRLKAQSLLEVAREHADFPIVLETYRECLRDVLDLPGLDSLLRGLHSREIALVEVETPVASPFASSLLFDYVATYMYEGDAPTAERRAAALSLDRDLLRELLGSEELRELIDPGALARVCDELQRRSPLTRATGRDELHDVLRQLGDLTIAEVRERVLEELDAEELLAGLCRQRRAIPLRLAGERRYVAAADAGLYRDALGAVPPGGLPEAFLADVADALAQLVARYARTHGPFTGERLRARYGVDASAVLRELERAGRLARGDIAPAADADAHTDPPASSEDAHARSSGRAGSRSHRDHEQWCDLDVLRRLRRASLAALRREIEPSAQSALASFLPAWHGIDRHTAAGAGVDRLREVLVPLQGLALPAEVWERDVLPRRVGAYSPAWLDSLCSGGELVWVGAGSLGRSGRVALYFREDAPLLGPPPLPSRGAESVGGAEPRGDESGMSARELVRGRLLAGACFFTDLLAELDLPVEAIREALFDLVWTGAATNDSWAPLRRPISDRSRLALTRSQAAPSAGGGRAGRAASPMPGRFGARRHRSRAPGRGPIFDRSLHPPGRWSLTEPLFRLGADGPSPPERRRALAELLLERHGILTREQVLAERVEGGFAGLYATLCELETLGVCRRGYFVEGLGGAQFALPGAVERLRSERAEQPPAPGPRAAPARRPRLATLVLAATDPAQPYGAALPWPSFSEREGRSSGSRRPARVPGAHVVLVSGAPVLYVERGGRGLIVLAPAAGATQTPARAPGAVADERVCTALSALGEAVRAGQVGRLALERIDGEPAIGSQWETLLAECGFRSGPRRLELSA